MRWLEQTKFEGFIEAYIGKDKGDERYTVPEEDAGIDGVEEKQAEYKIESEDYPKYIAHHISDDDDLEISDEFLAILQEREAEHRKDPSKAIPIEEFEARLKKKYGL